VTTRTPLSMRRVAVIQSQFLEKGKRFIFHWGAYVG
jgi:hypothetical protein